jgi:tetratricopeptide (TPR) repeat protein
MKQSVLCLSILLMFGLVDAAAQDNIPFPLPNGRRGIEQVSFNALSGTVCTLDNQPVGNARVAVRMLTTGQTIASGYTQSGGNFEFDNLPRGIYEVVATVGLREARERVEVYQPDNFVELRLPTESSGADSLSGSTSASVRQLLAPGKARKLFAKADELFQKQQLSQSREQVEKALQVFPDYAEALTLHGILNLQDNKVDEARADLEKAIKDDGSYAMGYIVLGTTYNVAHQWDDAVRVLERGIALMPSSWQAYFELSKALLAKGQFAAALRQIDKAFQLGPPNYSAIHLVRAHTLLGLKDYNQATLELEQFLGASPDGPDSARARDTLSQVRAFMASNGK